MGIFDWLFGKKETPTEPKKDCCSNKEIKEKIVTKDGSSYVIDGNPNGHNIINYPNGQKEQEGEYLNGKKNGLWKMYFSLSNFLKFEKFVFIINISISLGIFNKCSFK